MAKKNRNNLSYVGENIKKIRQAKKLSQADFSKIFNLARASIGAYEEGRSEPKIETLIAIANYFSISIDVLLTRKLTIAEIYKFNSVNEKLDQVHQLKGRSIKKHPVVKLIRVDQYLSFIVQRSSRDYVEEMEEVGLPAGLSRATMAIEMNGGEMTRENQGIHHGDILIGKEIGTDSLLEHRDQIVSIMTNEEIFTRRLSSVDKAAVVFSADDPSYPDRSVNIDEIITSWRIVGVFSDHIPKPMQTEERLLRIEEELKKLRK